MDNDPCMARAMGIYQAIHQQMKQPQTVDSKLEILEAIKLHLMDFSLELRQEHWHNGFAEGFCEGRTRSDS